MNQKEHREVETAVRRCEVLTTRRLDFRWSEEYRRYYAQTMADIDRIRYRPGLVTQLRRLIRQGRLNARKLGNQWLVSRAYLAGYAGTYRSETGNRPLGQPAAWEVEHA